MVWRRLHLRSDQSIADLHYAIQIAMNWTDQHLHCFRVYGKDYGVAHIGGISFSDDAKRVSLGSFRFRIRERFLYEYDFYDQWVHEIRLEKKVCGKRSRLSPMPSFRCARPRFGARRRRPVPRTRRNSEHGIRT